MKIVRMELTANDVAPPSLRYDATCDCIQQTPDGGTTWVDTPSADPRHADGFRLPPVGGEDAACNTAARVVAAWQENLDLLYQTVNVSAFATGILQALLLLTGGAGVLIDLIILALEALITIGVSTIASEMTSDVWDGIRCIVFCNVAPDGSISADQLESILADIHTQYPGTVSNVLDILTNLYGEVLVSNAGVERDETGDCDECECEWCYTWDFTVDDYGFFPQTGFGIDVGHYVPGVGFVSDQTNDSCSNHGYTYINSPSGSFDNIGHAAIEFATEEGDFEVLFFDQRVGGSIVERTGLPNGFAFVHEADVPPTSCDNFAMIASLCATTGYTIVRLTLKGVGTNPFGDDNC